MDTPPATEPRDAALLHVSWARAVARVAELESAARAHLRAHPGVLGTPLPPWARLQDEGATARLVTELLAVADDPPRIVRLVAVLARTHGRPTAALCAAVAEALLEGIRQAAGGLSPEERRAWADLARLACSVAARAGAQQPSCPS